MNFLIEYYNKSGYSNINTAKSAISAISIMPDNVPLGEGKLVGRFMRGIFNQSPSLPRYTHTWDVGQVLNFLKTVELEGISLKKLSMKLSFLLAILSGQRMQTLRALKISDCILNDNECIFYIRTLLKTSRPSQHMATLKYFSYHEPNLCIVRHLRLYIQMTESLRSNGIDDLLISYVKPHRPISGDTLSRWIKNILQECGVDLKCFSSHSTRSASSSSLASHGVPIEFILKSVGWSSAQTFAKFYNKPIVQENNFGSELLSRNADN